MQKFAHQTVHHALQALSSLPLSQFSRFLLVGAFAAGINILSRFLLNVYIPFEHAVALGYLVGMVTAFFLFRAIVFHPPTGTPAVEFGRFTLVNIFSFALVWLLSVGLARFAFPAAGFTWHSDDIAHIIGVSAPAATSYIGHRHYTFPKE